MFSFADPLQTRTSVPARRHRLRWASATAVFGLTFALAACSASGTGPAPAISAAPGQTTDCGTAPVIAPQEDPDNLVATMPQDVQDAFSGFSQPVKASAWAEALPAKEGPYKVGLIFLPVSDVWGTVAVAEIKDQFEKAKAAGIVEGELMIQIPADAATMTAADQIAGYQKLVQEGADVILMFPLDAEAMKAPVDAAGEQGIPTITIVGNVPSAYAVNVGNNAFNYVAQPMAQAAELMGKKGNIIIVGGTEGFSITTVALNAAQQVLQSCPDIKVVGTLYGGYSPSVTKSQLVTFLASHPEQIDAVLSVSTQGAGVWDAFQSVGRPYPIVVDVGTTAASLAHWDKATADGYAGVGVAETAKQVMGSIWDVLLRTMAGEKPILNQIPAVPTIVTNDNLDEYVVPGESTSSQQETKSVGPWIDPEFVDEFFSEPAQ